DILGDEDHLGDMDFKVAGSSEGITAIQMDIKISGISEQIMAQALEQARVARLHILDKMNAALDSHRPELSPYAPRIQTIDIPKEKIRDLIGPGGKVIRGIIDETGVSIDVDDDGHVVVASPDLEAIEAAMARINAIIEDPEVGEVYDGKVTRLMNFGAFVEILPGKEGLVHISEMAWGHTDKVEDVCKVGDPMKVKLVEIDSQGRLNLSRKALLDKPEGYDESKEKSRGDNRRSGGGGGGRRRRR
ncbi:MAG: S1 RNA-binding domain-containing protein, partial [Candidatus Coatesbacteria bacterium]|nr:S1 RNA-binding domain-containing protein [Candidatus Coatesbacteria bacterium]